MKFLKKVIPVLVAIIIGFMIGWFGIGYL